MNLPNTISLGRIVLAPFLVLAGGGGLGALYLALFVLLVVSDGIDGFLARHTGKVTELGARLDSMGDTLTYLSATVGFWLLWPGIVEREAVWVLSVLFFYLLPGVVSLVKFGRLVSYHTWIAKASAVAMAVGIFSMALFDDARLFHVAVVFVLFESVENIAITLKLDRPRSNLRSWWSV